MRQLTSYKRFFRPAVFAGISVFLYLYLDAALWIAFLLLAVFYFAVDVYKIDRSDSSSTDLATEYASHECGVLGRYVIDSTESYGLFLTLAGNRVFVDIREDKDVDEREKFARFLSDHSGALQESLDRFLSANPDFASRRIVSIGLHSSNLDQGEVFWEPEGYTLLRELEFRA